MECNFRGGSRKLYKAKGGLKIPKSTEYRNGAMATVGMV